MMTTWAEMSWSQLLRNTIEEDQVVFGCGKRGHAGDRDDDV